MKRPDIMLVRTRVENKPKRVAYIHCILAFRESGRLIRKKKMKEGAKKVYAVSGLYGTL